MEFDFGDTAESRQFFTRNPKFFPGFERLMVAGNKCLGRQSVPKNRLEDVSFSLSHTCREDFLEVTFLAVNGYGNGALKPLRGLYERAVTLAYISKKPEKAERFVRYAAIQEHRALEAALKVVTEQEFDAAMASFSTTASTITQFYDQVKPEFQATLCKKCATSRTASTWDLDFAAMVHSVGNPYTGFYLGAYTLPNFRIHATLASGLNDASEHQRLEQDRRRSKLALFQATSLLLLVMKSQNALFSLAVESDLDSCEQDLIYTWPEFFGQ